MIYADSGTRTNVDYFRILLLARAQVPSLNKKIADNGALPKVVYFRWLLFAKIQLPWLHTEICRQWDSNQSSNFPKAIAPTSTTALAT